MTKHDPWQMARREFLGLSAGAAAATLLSHQLTMADEPPARFFTFFQPDAATGSSRAVVVGDMPLVHTEQVFARLAPSGDSGEGVLFDPLEAILKRAGSSLQEVVKLNFYVADAALVPVIERWLMLPFRGNHLPAVTFVVGAQPDAQHNASVDAIAVCRSPVEPGRVLRVEKAAVLPPMHKLYVSGDAANGPLNEATRGTLESLERTLKYCGLDWSHAVHLKSFMQPISAANDVRREIQAFFGSRPTPALSFVEWKSSEKTPIEIEMVAAVPPELGNKPENPVEYLTPPGMTASPVFCRVVRVRSPRTIYVSGLTGDSSDPASQVREAFGKLKQTVESQGSDLRHLAKATYYVSDNAVSKALGEIRPEFYDPQRPPAASKAAVAGTGRKDRTLTVDMIAVPRQS